MPNLLLLFATPFVSSFLLFILGGVSKVTLKQLAVLLSLLPLALLISLNTGLIGENIRYAWMPSAGIEFNLSVDSLSLLFLFLTAFIVPISLLAMDADEITYPHVFYGIVLLLQGLLIGFFMAKDLVVFAFFYEAMLLPLYFIISIWGGPKRKPAAMKFLIYMIAGSVLMVAAILSLYFSAAATKGMGTFNLSLLGQISDTLPLAPWLCAAFLLAFAVKTPLFPFHAWLPDAYCEAPITGTILLSALLSKAGIYGILRVILELFPTLIKIWSPWLLGLAVAGVFYAGLAAWREKDYKRLIAYSSLSHVNFILVGLFIWSQTAHAGAILQALNHGVTITGLFLAARWLEQRIGTTSIDQESGLAKFMPHLCWVTLIFVLSSVALPGMNGFIGELMILFGLFEIAPFVAAFLTLSIILSVMYMLRWMQKMYFDEPGFFQERWIDIKEKEFAIALPLIAVIFWIGIYPAPVIRQTAEPAAEKISFLADERKT